MTEPEWTLAGADLRTVVDDAVLNMQYSMTIEAASTVTLNFAGSVNRLGKLLDHDDNGRLDEPLILAGDGEEYSLFGLQRDSRQRFTMTFEDALVGRLRQKRGRLQVNGTDDVAFARRLVEEAGGQLVVPTGRAVTNARTQARRRQLRQDADDRRERGLPDDADLQIKGAKASPEQLREVETVLTVADQLRAPVRAVEAAMVAGIGESNFRAVKNPGSKYAGVFQADPANISKDDTEQQARSFFQGGKGFQQGGAIKLANANPSMSPGEIATRVEASGKPGSFYQRHIGEGRKLIQAWGGVKTATSREAMQLARGSAEDPDEDSWTCLQRIAGELGKRCFAYRGRVYWALEQELMQSRSRATISEDVPGVQSLAWEAVPRKQTNKAVLTCDASLWAIPPGSVVTLRDSLLADGRWLVSSYRRSRYDKTATIELRRGTELLKPERRSSPSTTSSRPSSAPVNALQGADSVAQRRLERMYAKAVAIDKLNQPYVWGGGHTKTGGYDCSGAVSAVLIAGDLLAAPQTTVGLNTWGEPGEGKVMTVWVRETGIAERSHTFITFKTSSKTIYFEAGGAEKQRTGFHRPRSHAGFTPRHGGGT